MGLVDPSEIFEIYTLPRDKPDLVNGLKVALAQDRLTTWLDSLAPQDPQYRALSAAYLDLAGRSRLSEGATIASAPAIRVGDTDARRPTIIAALARERAPAPRLTDDVVWTHGDAEILKTYQRARGLAADGIVGSNTLALLNASPRDKARRVAVEP